MHRKDIKNSLNKKQKSFAFILFFILRSCEINADSLQRVGIYM